MKYLATISSALMLLSATAFAQGDAAAPEATAAPSAEVTPEPAASEPAQEASNDKDKDKDKDDKERGPYYKKVKGWLWLEAFAGPSSYDPDQFGGLSLSGIPNAPKLTGPQFGFAVGTGFGGPFFLGAYYRQANYTKSAPAGQGYKLMKLGLDMQGTFRFIPYVHPMIRIDIGYARTFDGNPYGLTNTASDGLDFTLGVGVRIPIVRWMSFLASFDWSFVGLSLRGDEPSGNRFQSWIGGQQLAGTFALTFHFLGVRRD